MGRRYDSTGAPVSGEFQVNSYTTGSQYYPFVAIDSAGNFVVAWETTDSAESDISETSIQVRRFDAAGSPLGTEFQVNAYTTDEQEFPMVALDDAGNFVVAWDSYGSPGNDSLAQSAHARRYDSGTAAFGTEFQVNVYTTASQEYPFVALAPGGSFVVAWQSYGSATGDVGWSVQINRFADEGRLIAGSKMLIKDPTQLETTRRVQIVAHENATDIGAAVMGDPTLTGAVLRIIANGTVDSDQTYILDAVGWAALGTADGYEYAGPTGVDDDPVKRVLIRRQSNANDTARMAVRLRGIVGTQPLSVVPQNLGDSGGAILSIQNGGTYCTVFGGAAGGDEVRDQAKLWLIRKPIGQGCPTP
jgi:hypothetical protein